MKCSLAGRLLTVAAVLMLLGSIVYAQNDRRGPGLPDSTELAKRLDELALTLGLTPEQKDTVGILQKQHFASMQLMINDEGMDRRERMETVRGMRKELDEKILALLNEDQQEMYKEIMKKENEKRRRPPRD